MENNSIKEDGLLFVSDEQYNKLRTGKLQKNDFVFCIRGSLGKHCKYNYNTGAIASSLVILRKIGETLDDYISYYLDSPLITQEINSTNNGTAQPNLGAKDVMEYLIPIPPLQEQGKIVKKIENIILKINQIEKSVYIINTNKKMLKAKIIDLAIKGNLTQQLSTDEPSSNLIEKILEEKHKLMNEGKIKKENLSVIYKDTDNQFYEKFDDGKIVNITEEIPFDIPDSWRWTRLNNIVSILGDGLHGTPTFSEKGEYYFINGNNLNNGSIIIKPDTKKVDINEYNKYKKELNNKTMFISINGTVGNIAFYNNEQIILGKSACFFNLINEYLKKYLFYFFKTDYFIKYALINATGTTIRNVSLKVMRNTLIPIPSLVEQEKIVKILNHFTNIIETAE